MWKNICEKFRFYILKESKMDGRWILLFFVFVLFAFIIVSSFSSDYHHLWGIFVIHEMLPPFYDTYVITSAHDCSLFGYNVFLQNSCGPPMNYPPIWLTIASFGNFGRDSTVMIGIILSLSFFVALFTFIPRITILEAFVYTLLLYSPSMLVALANGNNDLLIFVLLAIALILMRSHIAVGRFAGYLIILFTAILKLYPAIAFLGVVKERKKIVFFLLSLLVISFLFYSFLIFQNIKMINQVFMRPTAANGYGIMALPESLFFDLQPLFPSILFKIKFFVHLFPQFRWLLVGIIFALTIGLMYLLIRKYRHLFLNLFNNDMSSDYIDSFRIGASIYIGTFLLGNNYDLRFIFFLFVVPQIISWIKKDENKGLSCYVLFGIISTVWLSRWSPLYIDEYINWSLFIYFLCIFVSTLPEWLKSELRLYSSRIGNIMS